MPTDIQHPEDNAKINFNCSIKGYSINCNLFPMTVKVMELKEYLFIYLFIFVIPREIK